FHQSECVLWTRLLPNEELSSPELVEHVGCHRPSRYDVLPAVHNFEPLLSKVVRVANNVWNHLSLGDGVWHLPVGPEDHILHVVAEHRSVVSTVGFAHYDFHRHSDVEVLVIGAETEFGKIHHDGRSLIRVRHPPPALKR